MVTQVLRGRQGEKCPNVPAEGVVELVQRFAEQVMNYLRSFPPRDAG